jgi:hypothetical protein
VFNVSVDTSPPEFIEIAPGPEDKQAGPSVEVSISVRDAVSGLNASRVQYRFGTQGEGTMGSWLPFTVRREGDRFIGNIILPFYPGKGNVIRFRAMDLVGNRGLSTVSIIWVNSPPVATISEPIPGVEYDDREEVPLSAEGTADPDGDELNYTWIMQGPDSRTIHGRDARMLLASGAYNLTLVVTDDLGSEDRASVTFVVVHTPPPRREERFDNLPLIILIAVVIATVLAFALFIRWRAADQAPPGEPREER